MMVIVGAIGVVAAVLGGYLMEHGKLILLNQPAEFVVIGGAAISAMLIGTPMNVVQKLVKQITGILSPGLGKQDYADLLAMQYQLFRLAQQTGIMALEGHFEKPTESTILSKYPKFLARHESLDFLSDSIKVIIVGGMAPHDLEALMDEDLYVHHHEAKAPSGALAKVADSFPGLGIVAAVLGVVITMQSIDGPPSEIGEKVGAALVGTFLGILLSYGFFGPLASAIEARVEDDGNYEKCIKAGVLATFKGLPPAIAIEYARRVLPHSVRPSFEETEKFCKAAGKPEAAAA
ncbi:MAG: flagellar motor stator protein MotA [Vicinamibacterales bacterium]